MSPREFDALRKQWSRHQERLLAIHAGIQATLHNAHFRRDWGGPFTAAEFMPGYEAPRQSLEDQMLAIRVALESAAAFNEANKPPS